MYPFDDLSSIMKRRNIFGPNQDDTSNVSPVDFTPSSPSMQSSQPSSATDDFTNVYSKLTSAEPGPAQKAYRDFLSNNEPDRVNYQPSKTQRLAAILSGVHTNLSRKGDGSAVTEDMLDRPYNNAMLDYKNKAARYKESADVEEKDISNRVKTYWDIVRNQSENQKNATLASHYNAQTAHWQAQDAELKNKGYTAHTDKTTGTLIYTKVMPDGTIDRKQGPKIDSSNSESDSRAISRHRATSSIDLNRQENLFDFTNPKITARDKELIDYRDTKEISKEQRANLEWASRQANNPQRQFAQRALALIQIGDERPDLKDKIHYDNYSSDDQEVNDLLQLRLKKMNQVGKK